MKLFVLVLSLLFTVPAFAVDTLKLSSDDITSVYDGDTFKVNVYWLPPVFGEDLSIRLRDIDTPEMRSSCSTDEQRVVERTLAKKSRDYLEARLTTARSIVATDLGRDKYFRILATLYIDGVNINDELITLGHAKVYDGRTKVGWCE